MKVGLDIHGVIDLYPHLFARLSKAMRREGHEIHIITGQEWDKVERKVRDAGVQYDEHFSIVDHLKKAGTKMWEDDKGTWWIDDNIWFGSKGLYIQANKIDIHFDDNYEYAEYCPDSCTFVLVPKNNFDIGFVKFLYTAGQVQL